MKRERAREDGSEPRTVSGEFRDKSLKKLLGDLEDGLEIDENSLDECLQEQPSLFYEVAKELALYVSRRDAAKQNLQIIEASVNRDLRRRMLDSGDKVTEKDLDTQCRVHPKMIEASETLLQLNHAVAMIGALKDAFEQRSRALKDLCGLYMSNYFTSASAGAADNKFKEYRAEDARRHMADARRRGA